MTSPFRDNYNTVTTFNIVAGKFYDTCSSTVAGFILVSEVTRNCTRYFFNSTRNYTRWEIQRYNIHVVLPIDHVHVCNGSWTPMLYACQNGYLKIVQWFHMHGAAMDVTQPDNDGRTPMFIASKWPFKQHAYNIRVLPLLSGRVTSMGGTAPCASGEPFDDLEMTIRTDCPMAPSTQCCHGRHATKQQRIYSIVYHVSNDHFEIVQWLHTHKSNCRFKAQKTPLVGLV